MRENVTVYGLTKKSGEMITKNYGGVIVRISNVYGGLGYTELKESVIARLLKGTFRARAIVRSFNFEVEL